MLEEPTDPVQTPDETDAASSKEDATDSTSTDSTSSGPGEPSMTDSAVTPPPPIRRLRRGNGMVGGVAVGLARYFNLNLNLVRAGIIVTTVLAGFGFWAYLALWLLVPSEDSHEGRSDPRPVTASGSLVKLVFGGLAGAAALGSLFGGAAFADGQSIILALILLGGGFFILDQRNPAQGGPVTHQWAAPRAEQDGLGDQNGPSATTHGPVGEPSRWGYQPEPAQPKPPVTGMTLGLVVLAMGVLGIVNQLTAIDPAFFFGTAVTILGAGLVYGAFNRTGWGLIPVALFATLGLVISAADFGIEFGDGIGDRTYDVNSVEDVQDSYQLGAGELTVDLRDLDLTEDIEIDITLGAGALDIALPSDTNVILETSVRVGEIDVRANDWTSTNNSRTVIAGDDDAPTLTINAAVRFGEILITN